MPIAWNTDNSLENQEIKNTTLRNLKVTHIQKGNSDDIINFIQNSLNSNNNIQQHMRPIE